ncbi:transmembrane protein 192 [Seriola lalandi dorsalis]|uniref:transmembrane protein 192 n=1 Tax=Seriola lalandi dorsalis TaxID=1841481 RepID=UPI000C6F7806|nr:transmembrane protein 192 [Seriola lalandi dorsalis]XP_056227287.1 transmembrane protein 192 [Seriola aureovittata]
MESKGRSLHAAGTSVDMTRSVEEESLVDGPLISADALHSAIRRQFQTVPTHCHASLLSLLHIVYVVLSVCVSVLCVLKFGQAEVCASVLHNVSGDSVIVYGKVCLWVLVLVFTRCMQHHHSQARRRGYLRFYRETQGLNHLPLSIHSAGNVLLLVVLAARLSPEVQAYLLLSILGLELLVAVPYQLYYTVKVMRFNREKAAPDVSQEECSHTYSVTSLPTETGFREGSCLEEVVERQADLIEYLKQHNTLLSKRLLNLTAQH